MAKSAAMLLLASGCGCALLPAPVAAVEDVTALVQMGASFRPADEEEPPKKNAFANFFRTLSTGASADGDSGMSNFFSKASNLAESVTQSMATPGPSTVSAADHFSELGHRIEDWGKNAQGLFGGARSGDAKPADLFKGIKSQLADALPAEVKEKTAELRDKAAKAKETLKGFASKLHAMEAGATEEDKAKTKERLEQLGSVLKKKFENGVSGTSNSKDAQNLQKLVNFFRDDKDAAPSNSRTMGDKPAEPAPAQAAQPQQPQSAPMQQQPMPMQPMPPMQPQQWAPPPQAWQPAPGMMPMAAPGAYPGAYPMGAPPAMPQYPMGGMVPYPQQMR